jgi:hypothetical protein
MLRYAQSNSDLFFIDAIGSEIIPNQLGMWFHIFAPH